jgi:putative oxidoreductase
VGSAAVTLAFAIAMALSFGIKSPLDYSVFIDFTAAFLLATMSRYKWSLDDMLAGKKTEG